MKSVRNKSDSRESRRMKELDLSVHAFSLIIKSVSTLGFSFYSLCNLKSSAR